MLYNGIQYTNVTDFCNDYGLNYQATLRRLHKGWTPEEVIANAHRDVSAPVKGARNIKTLCKIGDYVFDSFRKAAEHFGITHIAVRNICRRTDDTTERYEQCLDIMCHKFRTNRHMNPIA